MTWRERIADACDRETRFLGVRVWPGHFTDADRAAWRTFDTCAVGEVADAYGINRVDLSDAGDFSLRFLHCLSGVFFDNPRGAERLMDEIEDAALVLKRRARA